MAPEPAESLRRFAHRADHPAHDHLAAAPAGHAPAHAAEAAKKAFGADIAQSYVNHLAGPDDETSADDGLREAFVRAAALATVKEVRDKVDLEALELTNRLFAEHRVAVKQLPDVRQQEYEDIRAMTTDPQRGVLRRRERASKGSHSNRKTKSSPPRSLHCT